MKFKVWSDDFNDESSANTVEAFNSEMAAVQWVDLRHGDLDFPTEQEVCVLAQDGTRTKWLVTVETVAQFSATEITIQNKSEPQ